ncbi:hypothetical protein BJ944DRAFT_261779 [Cunninghamella echinulata]|nr:hypothetical protein BJ944DRAFT_261779 [Cunninghamella echinulata]
MTNTNNLSERASQRLSSISNHLTTGNNDISDREFIESLRLERDQEQVPYITPMDPIRFLLRSAMVYTNKTAVIGHTGIQYSYRQLTERVQQLATGLIKQYGLKEGDRVGILCSNLSPVIESFYAIPSAGCVMVPINTRLAAPEIDYVVEHSGCSLVITHKTYLETGQLSKQVTSNVPTLIFEDDVDIRTNPYENLLALSKQRGVVAWKDLPLTKDEHKNISINYTSGSTGKPKGVMVTYRGAYLVSLSMCIHCELSSSSRLLWTSPLFHCNGWGFAWAMAAVGGTQIMFDKMDYRLIWKHLLKDGVTHYNGAPTVQNELCNHPNATVLSQPVKVISGGAALSSTLVKRLHKYNIQITQVYGLTETYGPNVMSYEPWHLNQEKDDELKYTKMARAGYNTIVTDEVRVLDENGKDVPNDGQTVGEVAFSGNINMKGYYKNPEETKKAFRHGYFHTGDLGRRHPDGVMEIVDRAKDVVVSGGENISSLEVESVVVQLEQVSECACIGGPDDKWGERPVIYIVLRNKERPISEKEVIAHCRRNLAGYKCPSKVVFIDSLPKTSTGKIQKYIIKNELWKGRVKKIQGN